MRVTYLWARGVPEVGSSVIAATIHPRPILTDYPANPALCRGPGGPTTGVWSVEFESLHPG
jgi:hypothetical protein